MEKVLLINSCKRIVSLNYLQGRYIYKSSRVLAKNKEAESETLNIMEELKPSADLSEEEIEAKRSKHRLPERVYRTFVKKETLPLENEYDFEQYRLRAYYGRHGKASGLNPGIQWPTRAELADMIEYDKMFHPPLQTMLEKRKTERLQKEAEKKAVEDEVDSKMANLDRWIQEYNAKIEKKKSQAVELKKKRENLIDEISEYLGYEIDPKDPRFEEAVAQREKEKKKAAKAQKQQESYDKMLAKLKEMAKQ